MQTLKKGGTGGDGKMDHQEGRDAPRGQKEVDKNEGQFSLRKLILCVGSVWTNPGSGLTEGHFKQKFDKKEPGQEKGVGYEGGGGARGQPQETEEGSEGHR